MCVWSVGGGEEKPHYASWARTADSHLKVCVMVVCTDQGLWVAGVDEGVTAHCRSGYEHYCIILFGHLQEDNATRKNAF